MADPVMKNFALPLARKHIHSGPEWGHKAGTDYWLNFNPGVDLMATATAGTMVDELVDGGWTCTSLVNTVGSGADMFGGLFTPVTGKDGTFGDAGTPCHALTNADSDCLVSPGIFGDAAHALQAARIVGKRMPRYLIAEFWASMSVASAAEPISCFGFFEDTGATTSDAVQYAAIQSDGVNFLLAGNAATLTTGPAISTGWHLWKIVIQHNGAAVPSIWAYQDGTIFSATAASGLQDEFPLRFGMAANTTNRPLMGAAHIYYDW